MMGRRALVLVWLLNPELLGGVSLTALACQLGIKAPNLANLSGDFSRTFNVRAPHQLKGSGKFLKKGIHADTRN